MLKYSIFPDSITIIRSACHQIPHWWRLWDGLNCLRNEYLCPSSCLSTEKITCKALNWAYAAASREGNGAAELYLRSFKEPVGLEFMGADGIWMTLMISPTSHFILISVPVINSELSKSVDRKVGRYFNATGQMDHLSHVKTALQLRFPWYSGSEVANNDSSCKSVVNNDMTSKTSKPQHAHWAVCARMCVSGGSGSEVLPYCLHISH